MSGIPVTRYAIRSTPNPTIAMATKNPRVVGYVSPENHTQLKEFIEKHSLTESKAIDVILSQFFCAASKADSSRQSQ